MALQNVVSYCYFKACIWNESYKAQSLRTIFSSLLDIGIHRKRPPFQRERGKLHQAHAVTVHQSPPRRLDGHQEVHRDGVQRISAQRQSPFRIHVAGDQSSKRGRQCSSHKTRSPLSLPGFYSKLVGRKLEIK